MGSRFPCLATWSIFTGHEFGVAPGKPILGEANVVFETRRRVPEAQSATPMATGNGAAVLSGSAPVDFLTRAGTRGYAALARQVEQWVRM